MPRKAQLYIDGVVIAGLTLLAIGLYQWVTLDPLRYFSYLLLAALASTLKVNLPGITGTFSLNFLFILIGIADFSFSETMAMGCAAALVQCVWKARKRPTFVQVLFNMANLAISIAVTYLISHFALVRGHINIAALMALAAQIFFVINTFLVSGVISMLEGKTLRMVWDRWFLWSFPYYLIGAAVAGLISVWNRAGDWKSSLLVLPMMYLVYHYYHLHMQRQTESENAIPPPGRGARKLWKNHAK